MTKLRTPASVEDALVRIANQVPGGFRSLGAACSVGADLVRAWGDPDRREKMPVEAIVPLDLLYAEHGGIGSPIFEMLEYQRDEARTGRFALERELALGAIDVVKEAGEAGAALIAASQPGASDEDKLRARRELAELDAAISRVAPQLKPDTEAPT